MSGLRILLVEDEILIAEDARILLERMGYLVVGTAASGPEAVQQADELRPDLILMDVRLQGAMNGVEAARQNSKPNRRPHHLRHRPRRGSCFVRKRRPLYLLGETVFSIPAASRRSSGPGSDGTPAH